jgi:hypothetical protein
MTALRASAPHDLVRWRRRRAGAHHVTHTHARMHTDTRRTHVRTSARPHSHTHRHTRTHLAALACGVDHLRGVQVEEERAVQLVVQLAAPVRLCSTTIATAAGSRGRNRQTTTHTDTHRHHAHTTTHNHTRTHTNTNTNTNTHTPPASQIRQRIRENESTHRPKLRQNKGVVAMRGPSAPQARHVLSIRIDRRAARTSSCEIISPQYSSMYSSLATSSNAKAPQPWICAEPTTAHHHPPSRGKRDRERNNDTSIHTLTRRHSAHTHTQNTTHAHTHPQHPP